ncbi:major facilitator superfamily transporter [Grosmannia clavigera kw1407]|uniref:Major facilitator superfamily transporter n=1 Tax=Grosmannia clavigera (strain kw1407 / UAMH 11150) TaxID=655863 RepID=F0XK82_GROCL|nr:major facilitator superfamily transporter [Grosmannia clavigera kw1407]EFX02009.1 major facilitator superfamily transporter [Grosmannia clavigera kw1407]
MLSTDETAPLLGTAEDARATAAIPSDKDDDKGCRLPRLTTRQLATLLTALAIFLAELTFNTMMPAINSMIEEILCRQLYGDSNTTGDCKGDDVQRRLAAMRGWQTAGECIPAILFTVPYGIMADKIGRRPVVLLAFSGLLLQQGWYPIVYFFQDTMPPWTIYLSSLFACVGSFSSVGPAMIHTILADVTPQAERASAYFIIVATFLVSDMISSPLGGTLLLFGNWAPLLVGVAAAVLAVLVLLPLPETLGFDQTTGTVQTAANSTDTDSTDGSSAKQPLTVWQQTVHVLRTDALETWRFIFSNRHIMLLTSSFVFFVIGRFVQELLLQYATKRYNWSWSRAAFLLTIRSMSNLVLFIVILPAASIFCLHRLGMSPLTKDLVLARISGVFAVLGSLMIAFAVTPWMLSIALIVFSLGGGFTSVLRSLLSAFVESHHQAMLNSIIGLFEFSGLMVTSPLLYGAMQHGLELGGLWIGLPFMYAAGITSLAAGIAFAFQIPPVMLAPASEASGAEEEGVGDNST